MTAYTATWRPRPGESHITDGLIPVTYDGRNDHHWLTVVHAVELGDPTRSWYWQFHPIFGGFREGDAPTKTEAKTAAEAAFQALPDEHKGTPR